jgi:hypothetical protein
LRFMFAGGIVRWVVRGGWFSSAGKA